MMAPTSPRSAGSSSSVTASMSGSTSTRAMSPLPRSRGREATDDDDDVDREPLLRHSSPAASRSRLRAFLSRMSKYRVLAPLIAVFSFTGGATWILKGLCICLGMMLMGGVGSFTLHQMMSPQIESLLRQRSELQLQIDQLNAQVENMTRIANSRLEMIHLLEQELDRQVVAAAAAADPSNARNNSTNLSHQFAKHSLLKTNFWTTLVYAWVLGAMVFSVVGYRIYSIARAENQRVQKARSSSDVDPTVAYSGDDHQTSGDSTGNTDDVDRTESGLSVSSSVSKPSASSAASASNTTSRLTELSPKLYKRAPGGANDDRLVHV